MQITYKFIFVKKALTYLSLILFAGSILMIQGCHSCKKDGDRPRRSRGNKLENCVNKTLPSERELVKIAEEIHANQKTASIDSFFQSRVKAGFNGALLVEQKGVLLYKNIHGFSNLSTKDSLTFQSTFQLASISKTFTGVAVLRLIEEGKIKLTNTIQDFIPDFPYHNITIAHLLSHRSGLPNYLYCFEKKQKVENAEAPNNEMIVDWFIKADPLVEPARRVNTGFQYNNSNFAVLARIVEVVTKKPFAEYMREKLFLPLGMNSTYIDTTAPEELLATKTTGYDGTRRRERDFFDGVYGDKGIFSTADDVLKWYHALRSGCLVKPNMLDSAFVPRSLENPSRHNYGYGFRLMTNFHDMSQVHYVYHGGWWNGYSNMFWMDYKNDFVIIFLSNKRNRISYEVQPLIEILEDGDPNSYNEKIYGVI